MKKIIQLNQGSTGLCTAFACFGAIMYNFPRAFDNNFVFNWCKENGIDDGNIARNVGKAVAKSLGYTFKEFSLSDIPNYLNKGLAVVISLKVPRSFWTDALDGDIDNYSNEELPGSRHTVYLVRDISGDWLINSWGEKMKPLKISLRDMKKSWFHSVRAFTFLR